MSRMVALGLVLVVAGFVMLAWPVISYTDRDQVADIGPFEVAVEERESFTLPPVLGGVTIAVGVVLMVMGRRPRRV